MKLTLEEYHNKILGCFTGKNIGGTLGAPFECFRGTWDLDFYTHDISKGVLPNDDLDLQLVFLNAVKRHGRHIDADKLAEYWLSFIVANWSEYGAAKNNLSAGLRPPLSGWYRNPNRNSCGAFIRSEIWACLNPGHPEKAVQFAYEDAIVDHAGEGVYAEIFCAALQSAAFCESNMRTLIDIALSYIPHDCDVTKAVRTALESYESGMSWKEARKNILNAVPGGFGMLNGYKDSPKETDVAVGPMGYDAPSNIGLMILGWVYGEGDFSKSICIAAGCGEDADCTAGTLAATMGIIGGLRSIDPKWTAPIGNEIKTISINVADADGHVPQTTDELAHELIALMPEFMRGFYDAFEKSVVCADRLHCTSRRLNAYAEYNFLDTLRQQPFAIKNAGISFDVLIDFIDGIEIEPSGCKRLKLLFKNNCFRRQWLELVWRLPENITIKGGNTQMLCLPSYHGEVGHIETEITLAFGEDLAAKNELLLEIVMAGRCERSYVNFVLIKRPAGGDEAGAEKAQ